MFDPKEEPCEIRLVITPEEADAFCEELLEQPISSLDSEWVYFTKKRHGFNNGLAGCLTFSWRSERGIERVYFHNFGESEGNIYRLKPYLEDETIAKIGHNCPSDYHVFANHGIITRSYAWDMMVADFLLDQNREWLHDLKSCAADHLGRQRKSFAEVFGHPKLKQDGTPYASGQREVLPLEDWLTKAGPCPGTWREIQTYGWANAMEYKTNGEQPEFLDVWGRWYILVNYATNDAWDDWSLYELLRPKLEAMPWTGDRTYWDFFTTVEARTTEQLICQMERRGMPLDVAKLQAAQARCEEDMDNMLSTAYEWAGCEFNVGSAPQLGMLLFGDGPQPIYKGKKVINTIYGKGFKPTKMTAGNQPSTDAQALSNLRRSLTSSGQDVSGLDAIIGYNKADTQRGTFMVGLLEKVVDGRLHSRINQIGASSGRWSSSGPNLQNITTGEKDKYEIRKAFIASEGHKIVDFDFSQLEYRLLSHFSQDPLLVDAFTHNRDLHSLTTYNIFAYIKREVDERFGGPTDEALTWIAETYPNERKRGKTLNFEIIYGVGYKKLAEQLRISEEEGKHMIDGWFAAYRYVKPWMNRVLHEARTKGHFRTLVGRYRMADLARLNSTEKWIRGEEERTLINAKVQGSAMDVLKKAMFLVYDLDLPGRFGYAPIMAVHDEVVAECPEENVEACVEELAKIPDMLFSKPLRVPLPIEIGVGDSWGEAK